MSKALLCHREILQQRCCKTDVTNVQLPHIIKLKCHIIAQSRAVLLHMRTLSYSLLSEIGSYDREPSFACH